MASRAQRVKNLVLVVVLLLLVPRGPRTAQGEI